MNAYRRLDPHFEAPNQIKASADRPRRDGPHPARQRESARIEVRSIAPDANPYLAIYTVFAPASRGRSATDNENKAHRTRFLPDNIYDAIRLFKASRFAQELLGEDVHEKFAELKLASGGPLPEGARHAHQDARRSSSTTR